MSIYTKTLTAALLLISGLFLISCEKESIELSDNTLETRGTPTANRAFFYALSASGEIIQMASGSPAQVLGSNTITGLMTNEYLLAIDFRPATGQLYAVSNQSRLYTINQKTGLAVAVNATPFSPVINGEVVGFDFNPTVDRIRLVTANEQSLRIHPETGAVAATDGNLNPGDVNVSAVAYTNSVAGASTTTLYDIDFNTGKLFRQAPPNDGTLVEVGNLGVSGLSEGGFDISFDNRYAVAVASLTDDGAGTSIIYTINLTTGAATPIGKTDKRLVGIAIPTAPVAYAIDLDQRLWIFNPQRPGSIVTKPITGLVAGEKLAGMDMRPVNGQLYILGRTSRIYTVNMSSGVATQVGAAPFSQTLNGTRFGFDFNPVVDRIRIVSNKGQNLRVHPVTGDIAVVDGALNPGTPSVDAAAYTQNFPGTTATSLYVIDYLQNKIYTQAPPNNGTLNFVAALDADIRESNGFDIGGNSGNAMGVVTIGDDTFMAGIDLVTGHVTTQYILPDQVLGFALGVGF